MASDRSLIFCPPELSPDAVVKHDEPSLSLSADDVRAYLRERMSEEQITTEIDAIGDLANRRSEFGSYGLLGLKPMQLAYACIDSGDSPLAWMHEHERQRLEQLKRALPTSGEQAAAARLRIQARIAERKGHQQPSPGLQTAADAYSGGIEQMATALAAPVVTVASDGQYLMPL